MWFVVLYSECPLQRGSTVCIHLLCIAMFQRTHSIVKSGGVKVVGNTQSFGIGVIEYNIIESETIPSTDS